MCCRYKKHRRVSKRQTIPPKKLWETDEDGNKISPINKEPVQDNVNRLKTIMEKQRFPLQNVTNHSDGSIISPNHFYHRITSPQNSNSKETATLASMTLQPMCASQSSEITSVLPPTFPTTPIQTENPFGQLLYGLNPLTTTPNAELTPPNAKSSHLNSLSNANVSQQIEKGTLQIYSFRNYNLTIYSTGSIILSVLSTKFLFFFSFLILFLIFILKKEGYIYKYEGV